MEKGSGIYNATHLESPYYAIPTETYTRLMKSSTRLYPSREPYVTHRMINEVEGANMRKEWSNVDSSLRQHMNTKAAVGKESKWALRHQNLNIHCGNLYV